MRRASAGVVVVAMLSVVMFGVYCLLDDDPERGNGLTIFAAASLVDVAVPIREAWADREPRIPLTLSFAGSDVLASQIREGAPADVFLAADMDHPQTLLEAGHGTGSVASFAGNGLAIVAAQDAPIRIAADLGTTGIRIVAAAEGVPISGYASELLGNLAAMAPDPEAFLAGVAANVVSREDSVRTALAKVELGEGDAAIVYASDALATESVRRIELPPGADVDVTYGALQLSAHPVAGEFIEWLRGDEVRTILGKAGFEPSAA